MVTIPRQRFHTLNSLPQPPSAQFSAQPASSLTTSQRHSLDPGILTQFLLTGVYQYVMCITYFTTHDDEQCDHHQHLGSFSCGLHCPSDRRHTFHLDYTDIAECPECMHVGRLVLDPEVKWQPCTQDENGRSIDIAGNGATLQDVKEQNGEEVNKESFEDVEYKDYAALSDPDSKTEEWRGPPANSTPIRSAKQDFYHKYGFYNHLHRYGYGATAHKYPTDDTTPRKYTTFGTTPRHFPMGATLESYYAKAPGYFNAPTTLRTRHAHMIRGQLGRMPGIRRTGGIQEERVQEQQQQKDQTQFQFTGLPSRPRMIKELRARKMRAHGRKEAEVPPPPPPNVEAWEDFLGLPGK
jgi:hypothetical protein